MDPPKLYSLAYKRVYGHIWQVSGLPKLLLDKGYIVCKSCFNDHMNQYNGKVKQVIRKVQQNLWQHDYPFWLKVKILTAVIGLNNNLVVYVEEISRGLNKVLKKHIRYCLANIIWAENNTIDMKSTILHIMKSSCLEVGFRHSFLARHCITEEDVVRAMENATKNVHSKRLTRTVVSKYYMQLSLTKMANINAYVAGIIGVNDYWSEQIRLHEADYTGSTLKYVTQWTSRTDALESFYELTKEEYINNSQNTRKDFQNEILRLAFDALGENFCCAEKLIFFYNNLTPENLDLVIDRHFERIFLILLKCWTHRHHCIKFYNDYLYKLNVEMLRSLFTQIADICKEQEFEYYDIISVVQSIWITTPKELKEDHDLTFVVIPKIVLLQADFESLIHFIEQYDVVDQLQVLGLIIFELYATSREHLVATCLKTVRQLGLDITNPRDLLDRELFKKFLLIDASSEINNYNQIQSLAQLLCDTDEQISALKTDLFTDNCFCVELLSGLSHKKDFGKFLDWALEDKQLELFKERLIRKELIHDIYDRRLIENSTIKEADCIFRWLKCTPDDIDMVGAKVRENITVINMVLSKMLEIDHREFSQHAGWLFGKDETRLMQQYLLSTEGLNAVSEMLSKIEDPAKYWRLLMIPTTDVTEVLECKYVYDFVRRWLRPYGLVQIVVDKYKSMSLNSTNDESRALVAMEWIKEIDERYERRRSLRLVSVQLPVDNSEHH